MNETIQNKNWFLLFPVALLYFLQIFSPLRLTTDAILYLSIAMSGADGQGFTFHGVSQKIPLGYPYIISLLDRGGMANSASFIFLNLIGLLIGTWVFWVLIIRKFSFSKSEALWVCTLFLLNFSIIKHVTIPMTDVLSFFSNTCALYWLFEAKNNIERKLYKSLSLSCLFIIVSLVLRPLNLALMPVLLFVFVSSISWENLSLRNKFFIGGVTVIWILLGLLRLSQSDYFYEQVQNIKRYGGIWGLLSFSGNLHLQEIGQLLLNFPKTRLPGEYLFLGRIFLFIGGGAFFWIAWIVIKMNQRIGVIEIYLLSYISLFIAWPCEDPRFWIPIFPWLLAYLVKEISFQRKMVWALYVFLGFSALLVSTRTSLSGKDFLNYYGDGKLKSTYQAAWNQKIDENIPIHQDAYLVIKRYGH